MDNLTMDFDRIDRELKELTNRFANADRVLVELEEIQIQFQDLAATYKKLKEYVSEVSRFNAESNEIIKLIQQSQTNFEQSFAKLRETNQFETENIHDRFGKVEQELNSHQDRSDRLDQTLVEKLPLLEECQSGLRDINNIINEFRSEISKIGTDVDREFSQVKKDIDKEISKTQEDIEVEFSQVREDREDINQKISQVQRDSRHQEKRMRRMRNAMIVLFILWLCLAGFVLVK
ncbi:hypothetical protein [Limnofasciculus baicalensis]|uniref:Uncharacterized protein n=1 Tax=Limnofasciculus baicalensis BBK-W-15 TaxID=2699891 RepID=A0AAE3KM84_9CYAN|nr:hypothetical protein [Limnofasciculus baicalensis]MCP2728536.1 hypothetical protein [Limnofasciculus baicalensis BBK-W-15]